MLDPRIIPQKSTDLCCSPHHLRHLGAQLVPAGAEGAEAGQGRIVFTLGGWIQLLVELQDLFLGGVKVTQPLPSFHLPLSLQFSLT